MKNTDSKEALVPVEINYGHIAVIPAGTSIRTFADERELVSKKCIRCGADFTTHFRMQKRCDACQPIATARSREKSQKNRRAKKAALRADGSTQKEEPD